MASGIYVANATTQTLTAGSTIALGNTVRKYGCSIEQSGNTIEVDGQGYYAVTANVTVSSTAGGTITVTALVDGATVTGATATAVVDAAGAATLPIVFMVKHGCPCQPARAITLQATTAATINNVAVVVASV